MIAGANSPAVHLAPAWERMDPCIRLWVLALQGPVPSATGSPEASIADRVLGVGRTAAPRGTQPGTGVSVPKFPATVGTGATPTPHQPRCSAA